MRRLAVMLCFLLVGVFHNAVAADNEVIGLTAGSDTGTYIKIARDIAKVAEPRMNIRVSPGGSLRNIDRIRYDREYQFAIVQYDALVYKALLDPALQHQIRVIFPLYNEEIHILVRRGAGIDSLKDLAGKRVNIGREDTGPWITGSIIRALEELSWEEHNLLPQDALLALLEDKIDAMIYTVGQPWGLAQEMEAEYGSDVMLLGYESEELAPYFPKSKIAANTYPWQPEDVVLHATKAILVTYNYAPGNNKPQRFSHYYEKIYDLVGAITENLDTLRETAHPKWGEIDPFDLSKVNWRAHTQAVKAISDLQGESDEAVITKSQICRMFNTC